RLASPAAIVRCRRAWSAAAGGAHGAPPASPRRPELPGPLHRAPVVLRTGPGDTEPARPRALPSPRAISVFSAGQGDDDVWRLAMRSVGQGSSRVGDPRCAMRLCAGEL